jgi:hypothetical protein
MDEPARKKSRVARQQQRTKAPLPEPRVCQLYKQLLAHVKLFCAQLAALKDEEGIMNMESIKALDMSALLSASEQKQVAIERASLPTFAPAEFCAPESGSTAAAAALAAAAEAAAGHVTVVDVAAAQQAKKRRELWAHFADMGQYKLMDEGKVTIAGLLKLSQETNRLDEAIALVLLWGVYALAVEDNSGALYLLNELGVAVTTFVEYKTYALVPHMFRGPLPSGLLYGWGSIGRHVLFQYFVCFGPSPPAEATALAEVATTATSEDVPVQQLIDKYFHGPRPSRELDMMLDAWEQNRVRFVGLPPVSR